MTKQNGWKPIPLSLKILFGLLVLWTVGSVMGISTRFEQGLPFFGMFVYGMTASLIVLILDIIGPIAFLYGLWTRKRWAVPVAITYMGIFILNSVVALFTVREQLGLLPILIPALFNVGFIIVLYTKKGYFR
jgi:hypothetical protein